MKRDTMIKYAAVAAAALLCLWTSRVYGYDTVTLNADVNNYFADSENAMWVPDGNVVLMGAFNTNLTYIASLATPGPDGKISQANYAILLSDFVPLNISSQGLTGEQTHDLGYIDQGSMSHAYAGNNLGGLPICVLVIGMGYETEPGELGEVGVFTGTNSDWIYPANMYDPNESQGLDMNDAKAVIGHMGSTMRDNTMFDDWGSGVYPVGTAELVDIIPEPSTMLLVGLGLLGGLALRRRHS